MGNKHKLKVKVNKNPRALSSAEKASYEREKLESNKPSCKESVDAILKYLSTKDDLTPELEDIIERM